jgi:hypothetical protein
MSAKMFLSGAVRSLSVSAVVVAMSLPGRPLQAAENQPPAVNLTYPKTGDSFPAGVEIPIMATVKDLDGFVAKIEFFANGVSLYALMNPGYALGVMWNTGGAGDYTLTATATDSSGATTTSSEVKVQVTSDAFVTIEATDPNAAEGNPPNTAKLTVRRWGLTNHALKVSYQVSGTATSGSDYLALPGSVTIPAGLSTADLVITPLDDGELEAPETVVVELLDGTGYRTVEPVSARATIADHDGANVTPTVAMVAPVEGAKFTALATILLKARAEDSDGTVSGVVFYQGDTVIGPGVVDASAPKLFTREWDNVAVGNYSLSAVATDDDGATKRSAAVAIQVVALPVVTIAAGDGSAKEGTPATDTATLVVSRTGDKTAGLVVQYQVNGTATPGSDYVTLSGTMEIPAGQADAAIVVVPVDDQVVESSETVVVELTVPAANPGEQPPYAIGAPGKAVATIADNDTVVLPVVTIVAVDSTAQEANPASDTATLKVMRTGSTAAPLLVSYAVSGSATKGEDYTALPGEVTIPAQKSEATIEIVAKDDTAAEGTESVVVTLSPVSGSYEIGDPGQARISILDNDVPTPLPVVTLVASDPVAVEPSGGGAVDTATFMIQRTSGLEDALTVAYKVSGTARNGADYAELSGEISISEGKESALLVVTPLADHLDEDEETVVIELVEPDCADHNDDEDGDDDRPLTGCYRVGETRRATARILDAPGADNRPPRVELVKPFSGEIFQFPAAIKIVAVASDNDGFVNGVEFWADGAKVGEPTARGHRWDFRDFDSRVFTFTWTGAQPGSHFLKAVVIDNRGAKAESHEVSIQVMTRDLPPLVSVFTTDPHAAERSANKEPNTATFKVQRTGALDQPLTVFYSLGGTAKNGKDYLELSGTVTIPARKRHANVTVVPVDDTEREFIETVILRLESPPANALPKDLYRLDWRNKAVALIFDNDRSRSAHWPLPEDVFHLGVPSDDGKPYRVEVSDDLTHWSTVSDTIAEGGQVEFVQPDMTGFTHRFYRVLPIVIEALDDD